MMSYLEPRLYIDGAWRTTGEGLPVVDPATEAVIGQVPIASAADLDEGLSAAAAGFEVWRRTPPRDRAVLRDTRPPDKPHAHQKYWQELLGQVGGRAPMPLLELTDVEKRATHEAFEGCGLEL